MPNYIIHVGPHKTGSTYIQRGLYECADKLKQLGTLVPTHWQASLENPNHSRLLQRLERGDQSLREDFIAFEQSDFQAVVLSHEGLAGLPLPILQHLRSLLGSNTVEVIYYVRRWTDWLYSAWYEFIVHGSSDTFLEFALPHLADPEESEFLNIEKKIQKLVQAFGRESVKVVSFSAVVEARLDLFEHFCASFLTQSVAIQKGRSKSNVSYAPNELELMRAMQAIDRRSGKQPTSKVVERFRELRDQLDITQLLETLDRFERKIDLGTSYRRLRPILRGCRESYWDLIVGPVPNGFWYEELPPVVKYISLDYMLLAGMSETLFRLRNFLG